MKEHTPTSSRGRLGARGLLLSSGLLLASGLFSGCGGSTPRAGGSAGAPGELVVHPPASDPGNSIGSRTFVVDENFGGKASNLTIQGIFWGRLVDVYDEAGELQNRDYVISESIRENQVFETSEGQVKYLLTRNAVTAAWQVRIVALVQEGSIAVPADAGTAKFAEAFANLDANLTPMLDKSLEASELGPFSMVPRDSVIVVRFDDMLEPYFDDGVWKDLQQNDLINATSGQLSTQALQVRTGYPPASPFEARVSLDRNHGDLADFDGDGDLEFYSTRILISNTVTVIQSAVSDPPLPVSAVGLPGSLNTSEPNLALRVPTLLDPSVGQTVLLRNASAKKVSFQSSGSRDDFSPTLDVVRALRSGGETKVTGDLNNGFLLDDTAPEVLGDFAIRLLGEVIPDPDETSVFTIPELEFVLAACAITPKRGDVLTQGETQVEVLTEEEDVEKNGLTIFNLRVRVILPVDGTLVAGVAQLLTPYEPGLGLEPCYVRYSPNPVVPPSSSVSNTAQVVVRFSKPMDPNSLNPFDTFTITRSETDPTAYDYVVGRVLPSPDLRSFTWDHGDVPFDHTVGSQEAYFINLLSGAGGPTDLAGNPLVIGLPQVQFTLYNAEDTVDSGGLVLHFASQDEYGRPEDGGTPDGFAELRNGQLLFDFQQERILPRPVSRFSSAADSNQPVPSVMTPFVGGVQTPLSPLGSKLHTVWRYCDVGFSHTDETNINIDIESLAWSPAGSNVVTDAYDQFGITLAHSKHLPDEILDSAGFPQWPTSGLKATYASDFLDPINDPGTIVHPRDRGYVVNPANLFVSTSNTFMLPFPLNQDKAVEDYSYYTWRDTGLLAVGGVGGGGVPVDQEAQILGLGPQDELYAPGAVKTIGLPLLMEFRCYPEDDALGLNAFNIALACNSSARPNFRGFSTGGYNVNNDPVVKDPDLQDQVTGGYNPNSTPPGATTPGVDCSFYIGEMALVTRVSRIHTIWFDSNKASPTYFAPVVEPGPDAQPTGAQVVFAYRGATTINGANNPDNISTNARNLEFYGENDARITTDNSSPAFLNSDGTWKSDITQINSARFFQVRMTFLSNTASNKTAEVRSLAFHWRQF